MAGSMEWFQDVFAFRRLCDLNALAGSVPDSAGAAFVPAITSMDGMPFRNQEDAAVYGLRLC